MHLKYKAGIAHSFGHSNLKDINICIVCRRLARTIHESNVEHQICLTVCTKHRVINRSVPVFGPALKAH